MRIKSIVTAALSVAFIGAAAQSGEAAVITLVDRNSTVTIHSEASDGGTIGMNSWVVDGVNQLFQQWFWYRIGETGGEAALNLLGNGQIAGPSNNDFDPGNEAAAMQYSDGNLQVSVQYTLVGDTLGTNTSKIGEEITIDNLTNQAMSVHFFQYSDFDLGGSPGDDTVQVVSLYKAEQSDALGTLSEIVGSTLGPAPSFHEANYFSLTRNSLNDGSPTTLSNQNAAGPGDVTWAFQWDLSIAPNSSVSISKQKSIGVPEPASLVLFGLGLIGAAGAARRRKALVTKA